MLFKMQQKTGWNRLDGGNERVHTKSGTIRQRLKEEAYRVVSGNVVDVNELKAGCDG